MLFPHSRGGWYAVRINQPKLIYIYMMCVYTWTLLRTSIGFNYMNTHTESSISLSLSLLYCESCVKKRRTGSQTHRCKITKEMWNSQYFEFVVVYGIDISFISNQSNWAFHKPEVICYTSADVFLKSFLRYVNGNLQLCFLPQTFVLNRIYQHDGDTGMRWTRKE